MCFCCKAAAKLCLIDDHLSSCFCSVSSCFFFFFCRIEDGLSAGDTLTFEVTNNFIVDFYDGTKSIVVSNTNDLGGRNLYWGQSLPTIGGIVLALALLIAVSASISSLREGFVTSHLPSQYHHFFLVGSF